MNENSAEAPAPRRWRPLEAAQRRVLGVLVEKAKTTPAGYPMSVSAIVTACNQKNNREPVTAYDDIDVERALSDLVALKVVSEIDWLGRVPKYKHHAHEWFGVTPVELAVLTELLLRGAQQLGDLRARASRMEAIADQAALKAVVDGLVARGLMVELSAPGRGQVVSHGVYLGPEMDVLRAHHGGGRVAWAGQEQAAAAWHEQAPPAPAAASGDAGAAPALAAEVAALRDEVAALRARVAALEAGNEAARDD